MICRECKKGNHKNCLDPSGVQVDEEPAETYDIDYDAKEEEG